MTTTNTQNGSAESGGMCEQALDYAYDELTGEAKAAFERHLPTCARCQAEVASFGRVRGAVRAVMPLVEPPPASAQMGSLHAQLMHAAAQRRPAGKVLSFGGRVKKVVLHPAFAMAASFVFVAGAVGLMWSHNQLVTPVATPAAESSVAPQPVVAAAPAPPPTGVPAGTTTPSSDPSPTHASPVAGNKEAAGRYDYKPEPKVAAVKLDWLSSRDTSKDKGGNEALKTAHKGKGADAPMDTRLDASGGGGRKSVAAPTTVAKPSPKYRSGQPNNDSYALELADGKKLRVTEEKPAEKNVERPKVSNSDDTVGGAAALGRSQSGEGLTAEQQRPGAGQGSWNGQVRNFNNSSNSAGAKPSSTRGDSQQGYYGAGKAAQGPAPTAAPAAQPTMPPPAATAPAEPGAQTATTKQRSLRENQSQGIEQSTDSSRRKADELARSGRCDDAEKVYRSLEKNSAFRVSVAERLNLVHCKSQAGQFQRAQDEIDSLKVQKRDSNQLIEREQEFLDKSRARRAPMPQQASPYVDAPAPAPKSPAVQAEAPAPAPVQSSPSKKSKRAADTAADKAAY